MRSRSRRDKDGVTQGLYCDDVGVTQTLDIDCEGPSGEGVMHTLECEGPGTGDAGFTQTLDSMMGS